MQRVYFPSASRFSTAANSPKFRPGDVKRKKTIHWMEQMKVLNNVNRALTHYDDFYGNIFGKQWPSMRLGLLSPPKYMAIPNTLTGDANTISEKLQEMGAYSVVDMWEQQQKLLEEQKKEVDLKKDLGRLHQLDRTLESIAVTKRAEEIDVLYQNAPTSKREELHLKKGNLSRVISDVSEAAAEFVPSTKLKGVDDFTFDSEYFASYIRSHEDGFSLDEAMKSEEDAAEIKFLKEPLTTLMIPKLLRPYTFENGSAMMFPPSGRHSATNFREYICVNGASILPIIALDLRPGINLLDICAGPGTKSILSWMTMSLDSLTCNDVETSRISRIKRIMAEFTGSKEHSTLLYTKYNARDYPAREEFSRVLVDVPCLNDRISCTVPENNIFKPKRTKERLALVKTQREILLSGFKALSKNDGSAVVYSTCTLSPIENDGVVMNALKDTEVPNLHVDLISLMKMIQPFERAGIFRILRTRCGVLVIPNTFSNFGPMYISRVVVKSVNDSSQNHMPEVAI